MAITIYKTTYIIVMFIMHYNCSMKLSSMMYCKYLNNALQWLILAIIMHYEHIHMKLCIMHYNNCFK